MRKLKAIWRILIADDFFVVTYESSPDFGIYRSYDTIKYTMKNFNKYFCDSIKEYINCIYNNLPTFSERIK